MNPLGRFLSVWRTVVVRDREIVDGIVLPEHRGPSPELRHALREWPGSHYWAKGDGEGRIVLIRSLGPEQKPQFWLHVVLFGASFLTVWMGGSILAGTPIAWPIPLPWDLHYMATALIDGVTRLEAGAGLDFAIALMGILLAHEMGHYILARRYAINASLPYFLPAPPWINFIGTFGAFIRLRSPIVDRRQLMDVGVAGPWAGFAVALAALVIGFRLSEVVEEAAVTRLIVQAGDVRFYLGDSLATGWIRRLLVGDETVILHPLALAGWFGVLVTMLNLLPLGQLDGGHVLYALLRDRQRIVAVLFWVALVVMGFFVWRLWILWAGFTLILGGGRLSHPTVLDRHRPLPASRHFVGWATLVLLALTFTARPFLWS